MNLIDPRILDFFNRLIGLAFWFFSVILLFLILYLAYRYISGGKQGAEEAKSRFIPILLAILIVFFALSIPSIVRNFFRTFFE